LKAGNRNWRYPVQLHTGRGKEEWGTIRMLQQLTASELIVAKRDIDVPFELRVVTEEGVKRVLCREILRLLPGKRLVVLGECNNEPVVTKVFLGRTRCRHLAKETQGIVAIANADVRTAELKWAGELEDGDGYVLGFSYLTDSISLADVWRESTSEGERVDVLSRVMITMARLHNTGIVQQDMHLANFLHYEGELHAIDGGGIDTRHQGEDLSESRSLINLALFFAQFYTRYDELVKLAFPTYEVTRHWRSESSRIDRLLAEIQKQRSTRKKNYLDKTFRECTRFVCESDLRRYQVCERSAYSEQMQQFLSDPDTLIDSGKLLNNCVSSTVALVEMSGKLLVIKRFNIKNYWQGIRRALRRSRAWISWCNAHRMEFLGIPAMKPVAMMEKRFGPFCFTTYFAYEFVDAPDAVRCLVNKDQPNGEIEQITALLNDMSKAKISHGDLKATNFLMAAAGPVIIDLDEMKEHRWERTFQRAFGKDLHRFLDNWIEYPHLNNQFTHLLENLATSNSLLVTNKTNPLRIS